MSTSERSQAEVFLLLDRLREEYVRSKAQQRAPSPRDAGQAKLARGRHLLELIELEGDEFIREVFEAVLGRKPDAGEGALYGTALREGKLGKNDLVRTLRLTDGGRAVGIAIWGLAGTGGETSALATARMPETSGAFESKASYGIDDFLRFHDEEFIRNAYRGVLRRLPDADGFNSFLSHFRAGRQSKVEVLGRLRFSAEGRRLRVPVKGLLLPFIVRSARRLPVLGRLLGIAQYLLKLPDVVEHLERLEQDQMRLHFQTARSFNRLCEQVEVNARELVNRLASVEYGAEATILALHMRLSAFAARNELELAWQNVASSIEALQSELTEQRFRGEQTIASIDERLSKTYTREEADEQRARGEQTLASIDERLSKAFTREEANRLSASIGGMALTVEALGGRLESLVRELEILDSVRASGMQHDERLRRVEDDARAIRHAAELLETHVRHRDGKMDVLCTQWESFEGGGSLPDNLLVLRQAVARLRTELLDQQRVLLRFGEETSRSPPGIQEDDVPGASGGFAAGQLDSFYGNFEDRFRGSEEEIRRRCEVYLPYVTQVGAGAPERPVLDIGCGRGEWLQLLRHQALVGRGVDTNGSTVAKCVEQGLEVVEADAIDYLRNQEQESLGAITGLHVIEHIPFYRLLVLLDECHRALHPGGLIVFETPNPENLFVGACTFYADPTHLRPLPPELTRFIVESRGFERVSILRLHPYSEQFDVSKGDSELRATINGAFYGARDYAVIGYRSV